MGERRNRCTALLSCALALGLSLSAAPVVAQFPDKPIRMVNAWPPGSANDNILRIISERLSQRLGQPVTVENRPGANGTIGTTYVAKAAPDGYTLVFATADTHSINPHVYKNLQYDAFKGFDPVTLVGTVTFALIGRANLEYSDAREAMAAAKQKAGKLTYASWGTGSTAHVGFALLEVSTGVDLLHVPFQGTAQASMEAAAGRIQVNPTLYPTLTAHVASLGGSGNQHRPARIEVFRNEQASGVATLSAGAFKRRKIFHATVALPQPHGAAVEATPEQMLPPALPAHKPSILQDLEHRKPMEVDAMFVAATDFARAAGVATPVLDAVVAMIRQRAATAGLYSLG